ncbi:hypothetical protein SEVIR_6G145100v4 [Setaria viridis]|uniref:DC1 domain-containing protein n=3 Tax=Setaria viridis TaxID=4556 RepID=A0A4V6D5F8_SETVI|nr:uncharacterized protein LOC117861373 [Setaria viridis]TKW10176.1 hypothetical protein SEVIR_6G145100v2 [Setaria viridis]
MRQHEDPPAEIFHPAHPAHDLKLVTTAGGATATFVCDGCKEPGGGARYTCGCGSASFDLHPPCALADEDEALRHPLFPGRDFFFLPEPPPPLDRTICDACGEAARGYVYHCFEGDLDLHPCCARLPERILQDGRVFDLRRKTSRRPCGLCGDNRRRDFWAYRSYFDGEAVDLHVACMKDVARLSWEAACEDRAGGGQIVQASLPNMDRTLQSLPRSKRRRSGFEQFIRIVSTVASIIIAVIFGNPVAMMAAIAGPGGFLRG